jgi:methionine aminopeptidase
LFFSLCVHLLKFFGCVGGKDQFLILDDVVNVDVVARYDGNALDISG